MFPLRAAPIAPMADDLHGGPYEGCQRLFKTNTMLSSKIEPLSGLIEKFGTLIVNELCQLKRFVKNVTIGTWLKPRPTVASHMMIVGLGKCARRQVKGNQFVEFLGYCLRAFDAVSKPCQQNLRSNAAAGRRDIMFTDWPKSRACFGDQNYEYVEVELRFARG